MKRCSKFLGKVFSFYVWCRGWLVRLPLRCRWALTLELPQDLVRVLTILTSEYGATGSQYLCWPSLHLAPSLTPLILIALSPCRPGLDVAYDKIWQLASSATTNKTRWMSYCFLPTCVGHLSETMTKYPGLVSEKQNPVWPVAQRYPTGVLWIPCFWAVVKQSIKACSLWRGADEHFMISME